SFRSEPINDRPEAAALDRKEFPYFVPLEAIEVLDGGKGFAGGRAPATIRFGGADLPNWRQGAPPQAVVRAAPKAWFLERLRASTARWTLWGNSVGMLDWRADLQNLPADAGPRWPGAGYALLGGDDWSGYRTERAEILDAVRRARLAGFATLA